ncbi:hypothetical protein BGZ73_007937 [Actinomortierella ambigua]|nr:hypothetical protein BGZ73_007937 [Actinomortierella ambigua]
MCCRDSRRTQQAKVAVVKPPTHLVAPGKSFGEPADFYTVPGAVVVTVDKLKTADEKDESCDTLPAKLVEEAEEDNNSNGSHTTITISGQGGNSSNKNNFNQDPFAGPGVTKQSFAKCHPPLPRYTTLPPANVYPIPLSRRPTKEDKKNKSDSGEYAEGAVEIGVGVVEVAAAFIEDD